MLNSNQMALLTISTLLSTAGIADEAKLSSSASETQTEVTPEVTHRTNTDHSVLDYTPRWRSYYLSDTKSYSDALPERIVDFDFEDRSVLTRASKLRNLSLLTLARIRHTRVYLGVNDDGLVGLHFNASPHDSDERYLELARMPYLKQNESDENQLEEWLSESNLVEMQNFPHH